MGSVIEREPSRIQGIVALVVTGLALVWVIIALVGEALIFFTLFGVWIGFLSGKEAVRYLKHHKGHSKNASDH